MLREGYAVMSTDDNKKIYYLTTQGLSESKEFAIIFDKAETAKSAIEIEGLRKAWIQPIMY